MRYKHNFYMHWETKKFMWLAWLWYTPYWSGLEPNPQHVQGMPVQWSKDSLFNKWCWNNWTSTCKKVNIDTDLTPFTKINSKWIKDLNVKWKTIKLLEGNIGKNLDDLGFGSDFLDPLKKTDKLDFIKIKNFCSAKDIIKRMKRQATNCQKKNCKTHIW